MAKNTRDKGKSSKTYEYLVFLAQQKRLYYRGEDALRKQAKNGKISSKNQRQSKIGKKKR